VEKEKEEEEEEEEMTIWGFSTAGWYKNVVVGSGKSPRGRREDLPVDHDKGVGIDLV